MTIKEKGFVLAFSLLISSIVLALAFGIFNILLKQIVLTSSARDSQIAFYAADAGAECALYWDTHTSRTITNSPEFFDTNGNYIYSYRGVFSLPQDHPDFSFDPPYPGVVALSTYLSSNNNFSCGLNIPTPPGLSSGSIGVTEFRVDLTSDTKVCALVSVQKGLNVGGPGYDTLIQSRGYNDCDTSNTRRVERAIEVKY